MQPLKIDQDKALTLLYVEDDAAVRAVTLLVLQNFFHTIIVGMDGQDGFEQYLSHQENIDLIITDITMPKLNGIEMIEMIRKHNPDLPILVISAHTEFHYFIKTIELGVDGYLLKPLKSEQFLQTLSKCIQKIHLKKEHTRVLAHLREYEAITDKSSIVSRANPQGIITYVNEKFCEISGYRSDELVGSPHSIIRHPDMPKTTFKEMWECIKDRKETWQGVVKNRAKNGDPYYVKTTIQPIVNDKNEIVEYIALRHDITAVMSDKKQLFDYLESNKLSVLILVQIEEYDTLEKFYDKSNVEKIETAFGSTLLYLMPNHWGFQRVYNLENGLYAFAIDRRSCRATQEEIEDILEKFLSNVKEYSVKIETIEYDISVVCSYTYGVFKIFEDAKIGVENAIKDKKAIVYADGLSGVEYENALHNIETINTIKVALDSQKIISYFQPIVNNQTLKVEKYESLVRLMDENGKILSPYYFLDIAKKGRYYTRITKIVLENSFEVLRKTDKEISINLSMFDIERDDIRDYIYTLLDEHSSMASRVVLELLESEEVKDLNDVLGFIENVKKRGVKIAIDDFGTGYSNFERLLMYQPDILKIDGSLIKHLQINTNNRDIVETIVMFAQKQGMKTVAEFVENEAIFELVKSMGIDYSQGYAFGKPELF
jgi:PAS domain S-box-containing protein